MNFVNWILYFSIMVINIANIKTAPHGEFYFPDKFEKVREYYPAKLNRQLVFDHDYHVDAHRRYSHEQQQQIVDSTEEENDNNSEDIPQNDGHTSQNGHNENESNCDDNSQGVDNQNNGQFDNNSQGIVENQNNQNNGQFDNNSQGVDHQNNGQFDNNSHGVVENQNNVQFDNNGQGFDNENNGQFDNNNQGVDNQNNENNGQFDNNSHGDDNQNNHNNGQFDSNNNRFPIDSPAVANTVCETRCNNNVTPQYNPICGSNGLTYYNSGKLNCAQVCGKSVSFVRMGSCSSGLINAN